MIFFNCNFFPWVHVCFQMTVTKNSRRRWRPFLGVPGQLYPQVLHLQLRQLHEAALSRARKKVKSSRTQSVEPEPMESRWFVDEDASEPGSFNDSNRKSSGEASEGHFSKRNLRNCVMSNKPARLPGEFCATLGFQNHKAIINASKNFEITKRHQQDEPGVDSGALSRSLASSRHRRPGLPGSLDCEPVQSVEAPRMLTASVSSNLLPTTTMSRLMKRARRATNKIQETCWGCILVVLLSSMLNDRNCKEVSKCIVHQTWINMGLSFDFGHLNWDT